MYPEVKRFGEGSLGETGFEAIRAYEVNSPSAITLENNEKFLPRERAENGLCREVGGATGTAV